MSEFHFTWNMDADMARELYDKQFCALWLTKILAFSAVLSILLPMTDWNFIALGFWCLGGAYMLLTYLHTRPPKRYFAEYKGNFHPQQFVITGKYYERTYSYSQIRKICMDRSCIYLITSYEGVAIPYSVFDDDLQKSEFIRFLHDMGKQAGIKI